MRQAPDTRKQEALQNAIYGLARYHTLNLTNLFTRKATVEFRHAAGTVEWTKMLGHIQMALALCERATEPAKIDWDGLASERTYSVRGKGLRELNRFFYLAGWTKGRRDVGKEQVQMAGWIADMADLKPVKRELRRLARKYDRAQAS
ncbi:MAG: amidoligase family protein [Armatimonadota bacterium]